MYIGDLLVVPICIRFLTSSLIARFPVTYNPPLGLYEQCFNIIDII